MTIGIFESSDSIKTFRNSLNLNDNVKFLSGTDDPTSVAKDAPQGSIYLQTGPAGGLVYVKQDAGSSTLWTLVGTSSGAGINYIANGSFDSSVVGWAAYADAAGVSPVDGNGGAPTLTITRTTSSPLRGNGSGLITKDAANRQGEGASYAFSIASGDQAKIMRISCNLNVASGTFAYGDSSDVRVYIYDVTNSVLIQPAPFTIQSNNTFVGIFQTAGNSTSYRLIFHVATTSASAWTLKIDDVTVTPQIAGLSSVATDWTVYTPTWTGSGGDPAIGNGTLTGYWRRVGDSMEIQIRTQVGTTTTAGAGTYSWSLPAGYSMDTAKIAGTAGASARVGGAVILDSGTNYFQASAVYQTATTLRLSLDANVNLVSATVPMTPANGDSYSVFVTVPIVGWANALALSQDSDGRVVVYRGTLTASQSIPNTVITIVNFDVTTVDTHAAFRQGSVYTAGAGTWGIHPRYIFPISGRYAVYAKVVFDVSGTGLRLIRIFKNSTTALSKGTNLPSGTYGLTTQVYTIVDAVAGDYIEVQVQQDSGGALGVGNDVQANELCIERIQGNIGILANESVQAKLLGSAMSGTIGANFAAASTIVFGTTSYDSHNFHSAGSFTIPVSGRYQVSAQVQMSGTEAANDLLSLALAKNGTQDITGISRVQATGLTTSPVQLTGTIQCVAGDILTLRAFTAMTAAAFVNDSNINFCCVERVGN